MARLSRRKKKAQEQMEEQGYVSRSQAQMIWQAFRRHRVGNVGTVIVLLLLLVAIFAQYIGPVSFSQQFRKFLLAGLPEWLQDSYRGQQTLDQAVKEALALLEGGSA